MKLTTITLIGFVLVVACAAKHGRSGQRRVWSEHLQGWHQLFGWVAFIVTLLIMMNPEFLALGLLGDAAFFDMLVLALSLQLRSVVFHAWRCFRDALTKAWSFVLRGVRRDFATLVFTLAPLGHMVLTLRDAAIKSLRQQVRILA